MLNKTRKLVFFTALTAIVYGCISLLNEIPSFFSFINDPFWVKKISKYTFEGFGNDMIFLLINGSFFVGNGSYMLFALSGFLLLFERKIGIYLLMITSVIYLLFFLLFDWAFMFITASHIRMLITSSSPYEFVFNFFLYFDYLFYTLFFIASCFLLIKTDKTR